MQILLKKREAQRNTDYMMMAYKNVVDVFIGMYLSNRERSGSVVECLTRDRRAVGSSLTGVTVLCP